MAFFTYFLIEPPMIARVTREFGARIAFYFTEIVFKLQPYIDKLADLR